MTVKKKEDKKERKVGVEVQDIIILFRSQLNNILLS
jgi:hypothetical protein